MSRVKKILVLIAVTILFVIAIGLLMYVLIQGVTMGGRSNAMKYLVAVCCGFGMAAVLIVYSIIVSLVIKA